MKAEELYDKACNTGGAMCYTIGDSLQSGVGVKPDSIKAMEYYERACSAHYAKGCMSLGEFYFQGWGVVQDYSMAKDYYKKACDLGYTNGCDEYKRLSTP